jgi:cobalt-zinc-cadmium resistance protein CzcA
VNSGKRKDLASVGRILVTSPGGDRIPLAKLARVSIVEHPTTIEREWGKRRVVVQVNVRGRDAGSFVKEAVAAIERNVQLPAGYFARFGGQFEHLERAQNRLLLVVPLALLLIFVLLYLTYGSVVDAVRVFTAVPFAAVGGVVALWLRDIPFSVAAGVGFVALSGVAVLGDMVLVSTIRQLLDQGMPLRRAVETAAERRLRPVLMTALVASFGFVPMALNSGLGAEVQRPLATVVIGGVISSTLLTLLVLPILYDTVASRRPARGGAEERRAADSAGTQSAPF